jgi:hypothetical protein
MNSWDGFGYKEVAMSSSCKKEKKNAVFDDFDPLKVHSQIL